MINIISEDDNQDDDEDNNSRDSYSNTLKKTKLEREYTIMNDYIDNIQSNANGGKLCS